MASRLVNFCHGIPYVGRQKNFNCNCDETKKKKKNDAEKGTTCVTHTCFHRNGLPTIARKCICIPANNRFPSIPIYPVFFFFKIKLALFFFSPTKTPSITEIILFFERRIYLCANENNRDLISHLSIIIIDSGQINQ